MAKAKPAAVIETLADLTPDPRNARRHNPRNVGMLEKALGEVGAARSIVIDEHGVVLAGNATIEAAARAGIERVQVVDADGETIIAVRRTGLTAKQKTRLALYDNRTAELADWDADVIADLLATERELLDGLFADDELARLTMTASAIDDAAAYGALPSEDRAPFQQMTFTLHDTQVQTINEATKIAKAQGAFVDSENENSNGNALARICETYITEHGIR